MNQNASGVFDQTWFQKNTTKVPGKESQNPVIPPTCLLIQNCIKGSAEKQS